MAQVDTHIFVERDFTQNVTVVSKSMIDEDVVVIAHPEPIDDRELPVANITQVDVDVVEPRSRIANHKDL